MTARGGQLRLATEGHGQIVDLTAGIRSIVATAGVERGIATVFAVGATVAVTTMEYEPGAVVDLTALLERLIPAGDPWRHNMDNGDTNGHAHLRAALIGASETLPVLGGELVLGTWQQVVLLDFDDRPRERTVVVQVLD